LINERCFATIGQVGNIEWKNRKLGKAGRKRLIGIRPTVRGVAQHPASHPHGGGEGRSGIGLKYPKTPEGQAQKIQDAMAEIMRIVQAGGAAAQAKGGRVGYQGGELVEDINVQETIQPEGMPGQQPIQPGGTPEIQPTGMSFEELRERLPATITDDIVILLSESAQALEDFATIQTQQDVDNFNTKYNVNLILPAEG